MIVTVNDKMQKGYRYTLTEPIGPTSLRNFIPKSPQRNAQSRRLLRQVHDRYTGGISERLVLGAKLSPNKRDCALNYFGVDASLPLSVWRQKGWIHPDDPRGWFQWYCRYYMGRRMPEEDQRQIARWKAMRRHLRQIQRHCEPGDLACRRRQRQTLLHWAHDSREI